MSEIIERAQLDTLAPMQRIGTAFPRMPADVPRVAVVHEWLEAYAGSERVLEQLLVCFPQADVFAVVDFVPDEHRHFLQGRKVQTSFIQKLPLSRRIFRHYLSLMPLAIQQLDLGAYDLVLSSNHAVAKGVLTGPDQTHISYVHSPMRYAWDLQHQYLAQSGIDRGIRSAYARWLLTRLRQWDVCSSQGVDHFIANSTYIAGRINKTYRRHATVIHPPVDIDRFTPVHEKSDYFLLACRFVPYKRADIVVEAFARDRKHRLVVVGSGPDRARVHALARNAPNIEFKGIVPQDELVRLMQHARAFVFAAEEDFGIAMVEAQACGTPVIAFGRGGARDIVVPPEHPDPTGLLFSEQAPDAVALAVAEFDRLDGLITSQACRDNALRFSQPRFRSEIRGFVARALGISQLAPAAVHALPAVV
ncbi:MAG TPA: glycosyltransferase [Acetobacteraceae bacterium]|jgi:glycosyltransferase involved in cell wall biosynthesis|nr:glycosyltransferase [Acetobacteraceae bacterium]